MHPPRLGSLESTATLPKTREAGTGTDPFLDDPPVFVRTRHPDPRPKPRSRSSPGPNRAEYQETPAKKPKTSTHTHLPLTLSLFNLVVRLILKKTWRCSKSERRRRAQAREASQGRSQSRSAEAHVRWGKDWGLPRYRLSGRVAGVQGFRAVQVQFACGRRRWVRSGRTGWAWR